MPFQPEITSGDLTLSEALTRASNDEIGQLLKLIDSMRGDLACKPSRAPIRDLPCERQPFHSHVSSIILPTTHLSWTIFPVMKDDPRLYRFLSNLLQLIDPDTSPDVLHAAIHEQLRLALPPHGVDAFVITLHEPVLNLINFAYFKAPGDLPCPPSRPLSTNGGLSDWVILNKRSKLWRLDAPDNTLTRTTHPAQVRYAVPLIFEDRAFGAMIIESYAPGFCYDQDSLVFFDQAMLELSRLYRLYERGRTGNLIINNSATPFLVCRIQDGRLIEVNSRALESTGYSREEILGRAFIDFFPKDEQAEVVERYRKHLQGVNEDTHYSAHLLTKVGAKLPVEIITILGDLFNGRPALIATAIDVTQKQLTQREAREAAEAASIAQKEKAEQQILINRLEEAHNQLLQSEKMASIGQLAAGVAHEINNPIGFVNSNLGALQNYVRDLLKLIVAYEERDAELTADSRSALHALKDEVDLAYLRDDIGTLLSESLGGLQRIKRIVQDLKDFSHIGDTTMQWANLEEGLESTLNVVWNELKYKTEVVKEYGKIPEIECIPSQLNQVFMNLLVNAGQAIKEHGTITLRTRQENDTVCVEVSDTGSGIPHDIINRIFDPFFTTKPVGKGTGLGLSISHGIINKHNGQIEVASEPGKGSTFRIILPIQQKDPGPE